VRIAGLVQDSIVDGPGLRFSVFAQGCDFDCEGCHNPNTIDFNGGYEMSVEEIVSEMLSNPLTDGLTLSGGEPLKQVADCLHLAIAAKTRGLNVWTYSGYTFEELLEWAKSDREIHDLLESIDILVDGHFVLAERTLSMKWRGSKNQRIIDVQASLKNGEVVEAT